MHLFKKIYTITEQQKHNMFLSLSFGVLSELRSELGFHWFALLNSFLSPDQLSKTPKWSPLSLLLDPTTLRISRFFLCSTFTGPTSSGQVIVRMDKNFLLIVCDQYKQHPQLNQLNGLIRTQYGQAHQ